MAEDMIGHGLGRDVSAANANGHDEFDLVVQVGGLRRVGQVRPLRTACVENGVGPLVKKNGASRTGSAPISRA
jgi:hypothetical protein